MRLRRVLTGALLLGGAGAALAPAGPDALVPFKMVAASAAQEIYVAVVIDFGNGSAPIVKCEPVAVGATDADALAEAAGGTTQVGYNNAGLLCSIDDYPAHGVQNCTKTKHGEFYFWSYWHGATGQWEYADNGPGEQTAAVGDVEGWRYQDPGPASPAAPSPSVTPDYDTICGASVDPTTTTTTTTVPASTTPTTTGSLAAGSTAPPSSTVPGGTTNGSSSHSTSRPSTTKLVPGTTTMVKGSTTTSAPKGTAITSTSSTGGHPAKDTSVTGRSHREALGHGPRGAGGSGGALLPVLLVSGIIMALAALAVVRWRRRPATE
jgi:hypothetical protein